MENWKYLVLNRIATLALFSVLIFPGAGVSGEAGGITAHKPIPEPKPPPIQVSSPKKAEKNQRLTSADPLKPNETESPTPQESPVTLAPPENR